MGANAITHTASGDGGFLLAVTLGEAAVTITVTDAGGALTRPHVEHPDNHATGGRGLALVVTYADEVRVSGDQQGHSVTAELRTA